MLITMPGRAVITGVFDSEKRAVEESKYSFMSRKRRVSEKKQTLLL